MLSTLRVRDYALIESAEVFFDPHFNVITGETGAGKSILLDALGLLLGDRARSDEIRTGAEKVIIEAEFTSPSTKAAQALLRTNDIEEQDVLIVRREVNRKGVSRSFINDTPVPLSLLRSLGSLIVDMHGQHEHQSLLNPITHIDTLDAYAGTLAERERLTLEVKSLRSLGTDLSALRDRLTRAARERDLAQFQLTEMNEVNPLPNEDEEIERTINVLEHAERITLLSTDITNELYDSDTALHDKLGAIKIKLDELAAIDDSLATLVTECKSALAAIDEIAATLRSYAERVEYDPRRIEALRERAMTLKRLVKKYGSINDILALRERLAREAMSDDDIKAEIALAEEHIAQQRLVVGALAEALSSKRKSSATKLEQGILPIAGEVGFPYCIFETRFATRDASPEGLWCTIAGKNVALDEQGIDTVEFYLSVNQGEPAHPLAEIASGGEISRIMLALKTLFAATTNIPVMAFDEIDVGISGRVAQQVGRAMKDLAKNYQVIAITHLPQIAAQAGRHFVVEKRSKAGVTLSAIRPVEGMDREREVAKLLGGETVSEANLKSARELMISQ